MLGRGGWLVTRAWPFARRVYQRFHRSRLPILAAALAYYAAFSLGPLLLLLGGWLGVVLQTRPDLALQYRQALVDLLAQIMPLQVDTAALVTDSFRTILRQLSQGALLRSAVSLLVLVWASSNFFASLQLALELIFDVPETRGFWRKRLVAVLLVLMVGVAIGVEIVGGLLVSSLRQVSTALLAWLAEFNIALPALLPEFERGFAVEVLRLALATSAFTLCYRFLPRRSSSWLGALLGALLSTAGIVTMRALLLATFSVERFNVIYGVVTGLLVILLWLYLALMLFLLGALVAAEVSVGQRTRSLPSVTDEVLESG